MSRGLIFGFIGLVATGLLTLLFFGVFFASDPKIIPSALIGTEASDFTFTTFDGSSINQPALQAETINLKSLRGRPVVLNFWASWCVACRAEAHIIEAAHKYYTPRGAAFLGIAINDTKEASLGFIARYGKSYLLGPDDLVGNISLDYGITAVPETFLIDPKGIIVKKFLGPVNRADIDAFMQQYLVETR